MSAPGRHLLITGFGPFPGMPRNPSAALARRVGALCRRRGLGDPVRVLVLRTAYAAIPASLEPALAQRPAAVLMIGVAARATRVRVEVRARNRTSRLLPDALGLAARDFALDRASPAERRSPVAAKALAQLRLRGLPAVRSHDAGRYLCNAAYFRALDEACPVLFLHIPPARKPARPRTANAPRHSPHGEALAQIITEAARVLLLEAATRRAPFHNRNVTKLLR